MKKLIQYENGDRVIWNGRAEIHYHRINIIKEVDLSDATHDEIERLKINPHNDVLLVDIEKRRKKRVE